MIPKRMRGIRAPVYPGNLVGNIAQMGPAAPYGRSQARATSISLDDFINAATVRNVVHNNIVAFQGAAQGTITLTAPAHNTSTGTPGSIAYDSNYFYVCYATNTWARVPIGDTW